MSQYVYIKAIFLFWEEVVGILIFAQTWKRGLQGQVLISHTNVLNLKQP